MPPGATTGCEVSTLENSTDRGTTVWSVHDDRGVTGVPPEVAVTVAQLRMGELAGIGLPARSRSLAWMPARIW